MTDYDFMLGGIFASSKGIKLQGPIIIDAVEPDVDVISVPGRNGDIIIPTGGYRNRRGRAKCYAIQPDPGGNVADVVASASNFLLAGSQTYKQLLCSYDPNHFWMARIMNSADSDDRMRRLNPFVLRFDIMPQKWRADGIALLSFSKPGTVNNKYGGVALPLITVFGSGAGTLQIGKYRVDFRDIPQKITLDCESGNAYKGAVNLNNAITAKPFPALDLGESGITFSGGITSVQVTPRWWDL